MGVRLKLRISLVSCLFVFVLISICLNVLFVFVIRMMVLAGVKVLVMFRWM